MSEGGIRIPYEYTGFLLSAIRMKSISVTETVGVIKTNYWVPLAVDVDFQLRCESFNLLPEALERTANTRLVEVNFRSPASDESLRINHHPTLSAWR